MTGGRRMMVVMLPLRTAGPASSPVSRLGSKQARGSSHINARLVAGDASLFAEISCRPKPPLLSRLFLPQFVAWQAAENVNGQRKGGKEPRISPLALRQYFALSSCVEVGG